MTIISSIFCGITYIFCCFTCFKNCKPDDEGSTVEVTMVPSAMVSRYSYSSSDTDNNNNSNQRQPPKYSSSSLYEEPVFYDDNDEYSDVELDSPPPIYEDVELSD